MYIGELFMLGMGSVQGHQGLKFLFFTPSDKMSTSVNCDNLSTYNIIPRTSLT